MSDLNRANRNGGLRPGSLENRLEGNRCEVGYRRNRPVPIAPTSYSIPKKLRLPRKSGARSPVMRDAVAAIILICRCWRSSPRWPAGKSIRDAGWHGIWKAAPWRAESPPQTSSRSCPGIFPRNLWRNSKIELRLLLRQTPPNCFSSTMGRRFQADLPPL